MAMSLSHARMASKPYVPTDVMVVTIAYRKLPFCGVDDEAAHM